MIRFSTSFSFLLLGGAVVLALWGGGVVSFLPVLMSPARSVKPARPTPVSTPYVSEPAAATAAGSTTARSVVMDPFPLHELFSFRQKQPQPLPVSFTQWLYPLAVNIATMLTRNNNNNNNGDTSASTTVTTTDELLAERGHWQAYLDVHGSGSVYYFHARTGVSQWEPPRGFPVPTLTVAQLAATTARYHYQRWRQHQQEQQQQEQEQNQRPAQYSTIVAFRASSNNNNNNNPWESIAKGLADLLTTPPPLSNKLNSTKPNNDKEDDDDAKKKPNWPLSLFDKEKEKSDQQSSFLFSLFEEKKKEEKANVNNPPLPFFAMEVRPKEPPQEQTTEPSKKQGMEIVLPKEEQPPKAQQSAAVGAPWDFLFRSGNDGAKKEQPQQPTTETSEPQRYYDVEKGVFATESADAVSTIRRQQPEEDSGVLTDNWIENLLVLTNPGTSSEQVRTLLTEKFPVLGPLLENSSGKKRSRSENVRDLTSAMDATAATTSLSGRGSDPAAAADSDKTARQRWDERRYAASQARQANLRKNYQQVVSDRSPTISLSAMKRKKKKDWFKYLGDWYN